MRCHAYSKQYPFTAACVQEDYAHSYRIKGKDQFNKEI